MTAFAFLVPLEGFDHGGGLLEPLLGLAGFVTVIAILVVGFLLLRRFGLLPMGWLVGARRSTAEDAARKILAERMAKGELSIEEFMERASVLNWTPGVEPATRQLPRRS